MNLGTEVRHLNPNLSHWKGTITLDPYNRWHRSDTPYGKMYYVNCQDLDTKGRPIVSEGWFPEGVLVESE